MPRSTRLACLIAPLLLAAPALAQDAPPRLYAAKGDIAAAMAKAASAIKPGQPMAGEPLLVLGGYRATLEYRLAAAGAAVHDDQAELFQVVDGSGTLVTGGTLVKGPAGASIEGGTARHVATGDVFIVPEGTPHAFPQIDGHLALITIKLPRQAAPAK